MVKQTEQPFPGQSDGQSHALSRNAPVGKGMQTTVDSTASSDPYYNPSSSAYNVQGNRANTSSNVGYAEKITSRRMWVPAGAGIAGFAGSHMLLRNMASTPRLAAAAAAGTAIAYMTSSMYK